MQEAARRRQGNMEGVLAKWGGRDPFDEVFNIILISFFTVLHVSFGSISNLQFIQNLKRWQSSSSRTKMPLMTSYPVDLFTV